MSQKSRKMASQESNEPPAEKKYGGGRGTPPTATILQPGPGSIQVDPAPTNRGHDKK